MDVKKGQPLKEEFEARSWGMRGGRERTERGRRERERTERENRRREEGERGRKERTRETLMC